MDIPPKAAPQLYRIYLDDGDLEVALDIVNQQVRQGLVLLELSLVDEGKPPAQWARPTPFDFMQTS